MTCPLQSYVRHFDEATGTYYYENTRSGTTQWEKPSLLKNQEVEVYVRPPTPSEPTIVDSEPTIVEEAPPLTYTQFWAQQAAAASPAGHSTASYHQDGSYAGDGSYHHDGSYAGDGSYHPDHSYAGDESYHHDGSYAGDESYHHDGSYAGDGSYHHDGSYAGDGSYYDGGSYAGHS